MEAPPLQFFADYLILRRIKKRKDGATNYSETQLKYRDIVGCHIEKADYPKNVKSAYVKIVSFKSSRATKRRQKSVELLKFDAFLEDYDKNAEAAIPWVVAIQERCQPNLARNKKYANSVAQYANLAHLDPRFVRSRNPQEFLVIANPVGGKGKAVKVFNSRVAPVLKDAGINFKLELTKYVNHAREIVRSADLNKFDGLIIVSGDGLIHEVFNGLLDRLDRIEALRFPICHIPAGSGNALAASICHHCGLHISPDDYAYDIAKMIPRPLYHQVNLAHIETVTGHRAAFLSIEFGITADVTIDTEKFRRVLGPARLAAGAVWKIITRPKYRAKVSYLPYKEIAPLNPTQMQNGVLLRSRSLPSNNYSGSRLSLDASGIYTVDWRQSQETLNNSMYSSVTPGRVSTANRHSSFLMLDEPDAAMGLTFRSAHTVPGIPPLAKDVPPNWVTTEDDFCGINLTLLSHVASDMHFMPPAKLEDQCMYLTLMRSKKCTRAKLLTAFRDLDTGEHLQSGIVELIRVSAVRIEPEVRKANMCVDGELVPCGPIQAVHTSFSGTVIGC